PRRGVLAGHQEHLHLYRGHHRAEASGRTRDGSGGQPALPRAKPRPRLPAPAVHRPHHPERGGVDVDLRSHLQRDQLDARAQRADRQRLLVARQPDPRDGGHHHRQHLAWHSVLRHHHPGRAADHLARSLRGRGHRRRDRPAALLARDPAHHQADPDHRDHVLGDLHLLRLPDRLRPHSRRPRQRDPGLRHLRVRPRDVGRPARHGRGGRVDHAAGPGGDERAPDPLPATGLMIEGRGFVSRALRLYLPLLLCMIAMLFPFYWMFVTSIKPNRELYRQKVMPLLVYQPTLKHYYDLLSETNFLLWTYNTMLVAVVTTLISLVLGAMIAYPLARMNFPGAAVVAIGVAATYLVPQPLLFIPMADIINRLELNNTLSAVMLNYHTLLIPFSAWLLIGY